MIRLVGSLLMEIADERQVSRRYSCQESIRGIFPSSEPGSCAPSNESPKAPLSLVAM